MLLINVTNKTLYMTDTETGEAFKLTGSLLDGKFKGNRRDLTYETGALLDEVSKDELINRLYAQLDANKFKVLILNEVK